MGEQIIISDTGPLIALARINALSLLNKLYRNIYITESVYNEATQDMSKNGAKQIFTAVKNQNIAIASFPKNNLYVELSKVLDPGETESLCLADKLGCIALIDEKRGRKVGKAKGIKITGTAGLLIKAKNDGLIPEIKPLLKLLTQSGYRLSDTLIEKILAKCRET